MSRHDNDIWRGCKIQEVSRERNLLAKRASSWHKKWKANRLSDDQRIYLQHKCVDFLRAMPGRGCHTIQKHINTLEHTVPTPEATREFVTRLRGYRCDEFYDVKEKLIGFRESSVRSALNSLIKKGVLERTRDGSGNTYYHIASKMSESEKRNVSQRETRKNVGQELEQLFQKLGMNIRLDVYETRRDIEAIIPNDAALKLRDILKQHSEKKQ